MHCVQECSRRSYANHLRRYHRRRGRPPGGMRRPATACPSPRGCCSRRFASRCSSSDHSARSRRSLLRGAKRAVRRASEALGYATARRGWRALGDCMRSGPSLPGMRAMRIRAQQRRTLRPRHLTGTIPRSETNDSDPESAAHSARPASTPLGAGAAGDAGGTAPGNAPEGGRAHLRSTRRRRRAARPATRRSPGRWSRGGCRPTGRAGSSTPGGTPTGRSGRRLPGGRSGIRRRPPRAGSRVRAGQGGGGGGGGGCDGGAGRHRVLGARAGTTTRRARGASAGSGQPRRRAP